MGWGGGTLSEESPSVYLDQSNGLTSAYLDLYVPLCKSVAVPHLAGFSTRQGIYRCTAFGFYYNQPKHNNSYHNSISFCSTGWAKSRYTVYCVRNVVAHGDAREGKWRGNWRMEWVASTLTRPRKVVYPALLTLMRTPRLPAVDWTDSPSDLNGLVCLGERQNVVSARVPSGSARALIQYFILYTVLNVSTFLCHHQVVLFLCISKWHKLLELKLLKLHFHIIIKIY